MVPSKSELRASCGLSYVALQYLGSWAPELSYVALSKSKLHASCELSYIVPSKSKLCASCGLSYVAILPPPLGKVRVV